MTAGTLRIGGAAGFWGDSMLAAPQLVEKGGLDILTFDYLAEVTMSIMARARAKDPSAGYATDFVTQTLPAIIRTCLDQNIRIIANAGGVNPMACGKAVEDMLAGLGLTASVAVVTGDDLTDQADALRAAGTTEMFDGTAMPAEVMSINAYLGALPIAAALDRGAQIVITGRCVDSAVTLGACMHHFGWTAADHDRLAGASLAGHVIECGAQATGGLFTDWEQVADGWANIGYPIVEVSADGSFEVSKPDGTGGLVSYGTVAEQILYEIGDPAAYILPDVVCDFTDVRIEELGRDRVRVSGARGRPATDSYKVSATFRDGYRLGLYLSITGIDAARKARACGEAIVARVTSMLASRGAPPFREVSLEVIGAEESYGANANRNAVARDVMLKLAARHDLQLALGVLLREATSAGTSMAAGTSGMGGNRPKPAPVVRLFSFLMPKSELPVEVHIGGEAIPVSIPMGEPFRPSPACDGEGAPAPERADPETGSALGADSIMVPLVDLAWARSGDKGNKSNIGVIARQPEYLPFIRAALTCDTVAQYFAHAIDGPVERFELPGLNALNFLLHDALGGGGMASLRNDPQGKAMAQILLAHPIPVPSTIGAAVRKQTSSHDT